MALEHGMIEPFTERCEGDGIVSYGLSSYGYDVRIGREFKVFTNVNSSVVDPKHFREDAFVDIKGDVCVVPPNSFALARTVEHFRIPDDVLTMRVYAGEGIAQVLFFRATERCETSYADRAGKYQGQSGITLPRVT